MRIDEIAQQIVWHSSDVPNITEFRILTHCGTWLAAVERALQKDFYADLLHDSEEEAVKTYMYQVNMSRCQKGIQVTDRESYGSPLDHIRYNFHRLPKEIQKVPEEDDDKIPLMLQQLGIDYLWYYNKVESPNSKSFIVINPKCFEIVDTHSYTPRELLLADPRVIDLQVRRGVWPKHVGLEVKDLLRTTTPGIKFS